VADGAQVVLLVGHCGADARALTRLVRNAAPGAEVRAVNDNRALDTALNGAPEAVPVLLLVNRSLDGRFDAEDGVSLIESLRGAATAMLVSNFAEAQARAVAAGALPGFGKSAMHDEAAVAKVRGALGGERG